jgi:diacylglycerol kinase (ATP)
MAERFDLRQRARSFVFAARGIRDLVVHEHNARIHLAVSLAVVALGGVLGLPAGDWALLGLTIALVWVSEAFNTAVEALADALHPETHPLIARAKDIAAGGVLLAAIAAATVGFLVLGPPLWRLVFGP